MGHTLHSSQHAHFTLHSSQHAHFTLYSSQHAHETLHSSQHAHETLHSSQHAHFTLHSSQHAHETRYSWSSFRKMFTAGTTVARSAPEWAVHQAAVLPASCQATHHLECPPASTDSDRAAPGRVVRQLPRVNREVRMHRYSALRLSAGRLAAR